MYVNMYQIEAIDKWLDDNVSQFYKDHPLAQDWARISKTIEELGEAIQKFIGYTGQNPRKGFTNDLSSMLEELADTSLTSLLAIQHFTKDIYITSGIIDNKLNIIFERMENHGK